MEHTEHTEHKEQMKHMEHMKHIKQIKTNNLPLASRMHGTTEWYYASDYATGELSDFEVRLLAGKEPQSNRVVYIKHPEGEVVEPVTARPAQYLGEPIYCDGKIYNLLVDFLRYEIMLVEYCTESGKTSISKIMSLLSIANCEELALSRRPLMLTQKVDSTFYIYWPKELSFEISEDDVFFFGDGENLYFGNWPSNSLTGYKVIVRSMKDGKVIDVLDGGLAEMPDGQIWIFN